MLSSSLPPSSPPRDSSPLPPLVHHPEVEQGSQQQTDSSSFWNQPEYDSDGNLITYDMGVDETETSLFLTPNTRALRRAQREAAANPEDRGSSVERDAFSGTERVGSDDELEIADSDLLPVPGSGDSAYTDSEDYTSPSEGGSHSPEPADEQLLSSRSTRPSCAPLSHIDYGAARLRISLEHGPPLGSGEKHGWQYLVSQQW